MKLRDFWKRLSNIKPELQDKEVLVVAENGMHLPAEIKFLLDKPFEKTKENCDGIVITW